MFIGYLAKTLGVKFVNDVWTQSQEGEKPLEAIARLVPAGRCFVSCDPGEEDVFGWGYCVDPYFMWDHGSQSLAPDVFSRFGERAISHTFVLTAGETLQTSDQLDHLACRYYRLYTRGPICKLRVTLQGDRLDSLEPLKAKVVTVTADLSRGEEMALEVCPLAVPGIEPTVLGAYEATPLDQQHEDSSPIASNPEQRQLALGDQQWALATAELLLPQPEGIHHVVLVVSNCGLRSAREYDDAHDDGKRYTIVIAAS